MRISDWSSDVCSSDLEPARLVGQLIDEGRREVVPEGAAHLLTAAFFAQVVGEDQQGEDGKGSERGIGGIDQYAFAGEQEPDRKSVVEGKSVSGRVDLGGRRIIKTKRNTEDMTIAKEKTKVNKESD